MRPRISLLIVTSILLFTFSCAYAEASTSKKSRARITYEATKIRAYKNIIDELRKENSKNVKLIFHISEIFPSDLKKLYTDQVIKSSKLYGSFFNETQTVNIYMYTERDLGFLKNSGFVNIDVLLRDQDAWFKRWAKGEGREHNLGGQAFYTEFNGLTEGHAGVFVHSTATGKTLRKYAIQVLPHEYFHVVQQYFVFKTPGDATYNLTSWDARFYPIFREGAANTISFAMGSSNKEEYLNLYSYFINEKKLQKDVKIFREITSIPKTIEVLRKIESKDKNIDAAESSYAIGQLVFEWVIAEYGFDGFRKIVENLVTTKDLPENIQKSLGISLDDLYKGAAPHIFAAFNS